MNAPLKLESALAGKTVLVIGAAGFLGKVLVAHLLARFPELKELLIGVREKDGLTLEDRLEALLASPALRGVDTRKARAVATDIARPLELDEPIDVVINVAGNVNFMQTLEEALEANALGTLHVAQLADRLGARLVHISTCYVAGFNTGVVAEDYPRLEVDPFDELARGLAHPERDTKAAADRRSRELGFPNGYTYSKAIGEALLERAHPDAVVVRPAIVESSETFPFPGWIEGLNTCAGLIALSYHGHRQFPTSRGHISDLVPVDHVTSAIIAAAAADDARGVYQVGTSDSNPLDTWRIAPMSKAAFHSLGIMQHPRAVTREKYRLTSAPLFRRLVDLTLKLTPRPFRARLEKVRKKLRLVERTFELYMPFVADLSYEFRCDRTRALVARTRPIDRERLHYAPESLDWTRYWQDVQVPGVARWELNHGD
jgi:long-chain acyl-CoA synthetase